MCRMNHLTPILSLSIFIGIASAACSGDVVEGSSAVCSESSGSSPTTTSNTGGTASSASTSGSGSSTTSGNTTSTTEAGDLSGSSDQTSMVLDVGSLDCGIINVCQLESDCDAAGLGQKCSFWLMWCMDVCTRDCEFPCISATERAFGDDLCPPCDLTNVVN